MMFKKTPQETSRALGREAAKEEINRLALDLFNAALDDNASWRTRWANFYQLERTRELADRDNIYIRTVCSGKMGVLQAELLQELITGVKVSSDEWYESIKRDNVE